MNGFFAIAVDLLVAVLLVATIISSVGLSKRMSRMRADESAMRTTIADLIVATDTAERAIAGLKSLLGESDRTLSERLRTAERYSEDLATRVHAGETVMSRIAQIVDTSRRAAEPEAAPRPPKPSNDVEGDVKVEKFKAEAANEGMLTAAAAAAQAVADRAARRVGARAA
jgi:low affinity Fe/Cu permease